MIKSSVRGLPCTVTLEIDDSGQNSNMVVVRIPVNVDKDDTLLWEKIIASQLDVLVPPTAEYFERLNAVLRQLALLEIPYHMYRVNDDHVIQIPQRQKGVKAHAKQISCG